MQQILTQTLYNINICQQLKNASHSQNEPQLKKASHTYEALGHHLINMSLFDYMGEGGLINIPTLGIGSAGRSPAATAVRPRVA